MTQDSWIRHPDPIAAYLLCHQHAASECPVVFAAWKGFESRLRHRRALSSCGTGGHQIWWRIDAPDATSALALLPSYVAVRTTVVEVGEVAVP